MCTEVSSQIQFRFNLAARDRVVGWKPGGMDDILAREG
jgi:hypothetical protein